MSNHDPIPPAARRLDRLYAPPEIGAPGKRRALAERRQLLLAGGFVLAMALVVVAAFALILPGLLGQAYRLEAYFPDAEGLDPGMQLIQEGYVIGLVERVKPVFPGDPAHGRHCPLPAAEAPPRSPILPCFRATLRIRDQWPIPQDSEVRLTTLGLLKGNALRIAVGQSAELLAPGAVIAALAPEPDLTQQLAVLRSLRGGQAMALIATDNTTEALGDTADQVAVLSGGRLLFQGTREALAAVSPGDLELGAALGGRF